MNDPKPGIKTTEFWTTVGAIIASVMVAACQPDTIERVAPWAETACVIATGIAAGLYALSRGLAKKR